MGHGCGYRHRRGHAITTRSSNSTYQKVIHNQEPDRDGGGSSLTSGDGQGGAAHITPENRDISNQQTVNIDLLLIGAGFTEKLSGMPRPVQRPQVNEHWEWVKQFSSVPTLATPSNAESDGTSNYSGRSANGATKNTLSPVFLKKGNTVYNRGTGLTTKQDAKGGGALTFEKARDTFPKVKSPGYDYPH